MLRTKRYQKAQLEALLQQFDMEVEKKCAAMRSKADYTCVQLREHMQVGVIGLSRAVKDMRMEDLRNKYGGDVGLAMRATTPARQARPRPSRAPLQAAGLSSLLSMQVGALNSETEREKIRLQLEQLLKTVDQLPVSANA